MQFINMQFYALLVESMRQIWHQNTIDTGEIKLKHHALACTVWLAKTHYSSQHWGGVIRTARRFKVRKYLRVDSTQSVNG